jgi:hypothetical protein
MSREKRIAENEAFCRDLNRSKDDWLRSGLQVAGFRCECWRLDCGRPAATFEARMAGGPLATGTLRRRAWAYGD